MGVAEDKAKAVPRALVFGIPTHTERGSLCWYGVWGSQSEMILKFDKKAERFLLFCYGTICSVMKQPVA